MHRSIDGSSYRESAPRRTPPQEPTSPASPGSAGIQIQSPAISHGRARFASGGGPQIRTPQDPPPGKVKNSGGVWTPPPGKVKNSGGVRAKKARCFLALESTKKLTKIFSGLFLHHYRNFPQNSQNIFIFIEISSFLFFLKKNCRELLLSFLEKIGLERDI